MELKGKVHEIGAIQEISDKFKKRDIIIEYAENPTYPEYIRFEALQDKASLFDSVSVGDEVEVNFNLRGRPWTDKNGKTSYFNTLVVWRIHKIGSYNTKMNPSQADWETPEYARGNPDNINAAPGDEDDLPF